MIENHWSCLTRTRGQLGASPHSVKLYLFFYSWLQNLVTVLLFLLFLIFKYSTEFTISLVFKMHVTLSE